MKLHLPSSLRKALLLSLSTLAFFSQTVQAEIMHNSATLLTYSDFASNMGRYSIYQQNELLKHLKEEGVYISFTQGEEPYLLENGVISFESAVDGGPFTAIGYNVTATVQHNGVTNPVFTGRFIGSDQSVHYAGIEYRSCKNNNFLLTPKTDYKITRLSKVITDITPSTLFDTEAYVKDGGQVKGMLQYHMGGGYQQRADENGKTTWLREAYVYVTAGIVEITGFSRETEYDVTTGVGPQDVRGIYDDSYTIGMTGVMGGDQWGPNTAGTPSHPLPYVTQGGDSGSPVWVWNASSRQYELISCHQARGGNNSYSRGASEWTKDTLEHFTKRVDMDSEGCNHEVHITAVDQQDATVISDIANGSQEVSTQPWRGRVILSDEQQLDFIGVEHGVNTWNNLVALKDGRIPDGDGDEKSVNWYAYGNEYLNSTYNEGGDLEYADLFMTENLNFQSSAAENTIILDADVDLGIGYAQFSTKDGSKNVSYTIKDEQNNTRQFNHAGYIIDEGVSVHVKLVNNQKDANGTDYFREWRKVGEGDLYLEGSGDNHIFLNVGGTGTTYLQETNGYAAYNVLINNGATVNLGGDVSQIRRDVTFGYGGGLLDFAAKADQNVTMDWRSTTSGAAPEDGRFTISALTQDAVIANTTGTATLTYKADTDTTFLGSFWDGTVKDKDDRYIRPENAGTLKVIYAGDANTTWTLNSIHTKLSGESGLEVRTGTVKLVGRLTEHAQGSLTGYNQQRYSNPDDWHYADAAMNVTVNSGATFELGSHARLTGNVAVQDGGIFQMDEGVRHQKEYIEGWYELEDTYKIATYYGLYGDVNLQGTNSMMKVQFSVGTDANTTVTGKISGKGGMTVDTAGGSLTLSGANTFEGTKTVTNGLLVLADANAAGSMATNRWKLQEKAQFAVRNTTAQEALTLVDKSSSGVLVLTANETGEPIDMGGYERLIIGAEQGQEIQLGAENSEHTLKAVNHKWNLGGGGGNLVVNYQLQDESATLMLGNQYTIGSVTLTNRENKIHEIEFAGKVTLAYTEQAALGRADIKLGYTNRIMGTDGTIGLINTESDGVMLLDNMANRDIDLTGHTNLHFGSAGDIVYTGNISLDKGADTYYFGGITGTLKLNSVLEDQNGVETNLVLDGQTYSGGVLELGSVLKISGYVWLNGNRDTDAKQGGDITLSLMQKDSLVEQAVYLWEGGILDLNGTEQNLNTLYADTGSQIIDSSFDKSAILRIHNDYWSALAGVVDVGSIYIDGKEMSLGGQMTYGKMELSEGGVVLAADDVLSSTGRTVLHDTHLDMKTWSATTQLELNNSTVQLGENSDKKSSAELYGSISTVEGTEDNSLVFNSSYTKVNSVVDVAKGSKLTVIAMKDDNGQEVTAKFSSAVFAESGGTVVMEAARVNLENSTGTHFGGTLDIQGKNGAMTLYGSGGSDNILREIDKLKVQADTTLTLQESSRNTIWNIHELTGAGNVTWNSQSTHWYSSRVLLGALVNSEEGGTFKPDEDMGTYSGVFTVLRSNVGAEENRVYASYVELAHDTIMQGAKVDLQGCERGYVSMAVNTDNGSVQGLDGNSYSVLYAGPAVEGGDKENNQLQYAPVSTRKANLVIKGGETSNFAGSVQAGSEGSGLSIVMDGQGTQNFSGEDVNLVNVTVNKGTLGFTNETALPNIAGQISIAQDATMDLGGKVLTLKEGNVLAVLPGEEGSHASATLNGSLLLSGGSLLFSGDAVVNATGGALNLEGSAQLAQDATLTINFSEELSLQAGKTYTLSTGNWSSVDTTSIHQGEFIYFNAQFATSGDALTVTLSDRTDMQVWNGTTQKSIWNSSNFGDQSNQLNDQKIAVFNDEAQSTAVSIADTVAAKQLLFDNSTKNYTLTASSGNGVTVESLRQVGTATTTLGSGVTVTGSANVEAGTLVLDSGSSVGSATVAEGAELKLAGVLANVPASIAGGGSLVVALDGETSSVGSTDIAKILIQSGTLKVDNQPLGVRESLLVAGAGTLHATRTDFLDEKSKDLPIQLAGTLKLEIGSNQDFTYTVASPRDAEGVAQKGDIIKTGSGTVTLKSSVSADTVTVSQGTLTMTDDIVVLDFMSGVNSVEVNAGASVTIGRSEYTVAGDAFGIGFAVEGKNSKVSLSLAKSAAKTINGNVSVTNGGTLRKFDGGLILAGTTKLGNGSADSVSLASDWGKSGWLFTSKVEGGGTVNLSSAWGDVKELYTFSNDANTFDGTFVSNGKTRLVAGSDNALGYADVLLKNGGGLLVATENARIGNLAGTATDTAGSLIELKGDQERMSGTLTVNQTAEAVFAGTIGTGVALVKEGNAKLTLSGNNTYTGGTTVNNGTLVAGSASALGTGSITLTGGELDLTAKVTAEALTMSGGKLVLGGENWISTSGNISLTGGELDLSGMAVTAGNNYTLATGANVTVADGVTFTLANQGLRDQFTLVSQNNSLVLFYGQPAPATDLIWDNSSGNGQWDIQNSQNWHAHGQSAGSSRFAEASNALFDESANNKTVTLAQDITAGTVTLEDATHVTIAGAHELKAGRLTGEGTLTAGDSATLTFNGGVSEKEPDAVSGTVNLEIADGGTVNVNGGTGNVLQDITLREGGELNFGAGTSTSIAGNLVLDGTLTNNGALSIESGSVSQDACGTITGGGQTTLHGTIANTGTLVMDNANLTGEENAVITGNVVINGGTFSGNMTLGSVGSTITVTDVFNVAADASYTVDGHMVLDDLAPSWIWMDGAEYDKENNGFIAFAFITIYNTDSEEDPLVFSEGSSVTYKGISGTVFGGEFEIDASDYTTFHVNTSDRGLELYSTAKIAAENASRGDDFKNVRLAAGTGFKMDSEGALGKVTVDEGEEAAVLAVSNAAAIDAVEMGADLTITGEASLQIGSVQAAASETLTVNGPAVTVTGDMNNFNGSVDVQSGIMEIMNAASVDVKDVTIGANATLGVYSNATVAEADEGTLTIKNTQRLTAGKNAKLNANLVMESGSTLDVSATGGAGLLMGSSVTLNPGVTLSAGDMAAITALGFMDQYTLFTGVDAFSYDGTAPASTPIALDSETWVKASELFSNSEFTGGKDYYVFYSGVQNGSNVGAVYVMLLPEPTTGTLSLLALAALAARRRRR